MILTLATFSLVLTTVPTVFHSKTIAFNTANNYLSTSKAEVLGAEIYVYVLMRSNDGLSFAVKKYNVTAAPTMMAFNTVNFPNSVSNTYFNYLYTDLFIMLTGLDDINGNSYTFKLDKSSLTILSNFTANSISYGVFIPTQNYVHKVTSTM